VSDVYNAALAEDVYRLRKQLFQLPLLQGISSVYTAHCTHVCVYGACVYMYICSGTCMYICMCRKYSSDMDRGVHACVAADQIISYITYTTILLSHSYTAQHSACLV
jgi:hypothetical protein